MIARDTMHQQQWLAVIEDMGGLNEVLPIPNSFPQTEETQKYSYAFFATEVNQASPEAGRWTSGPSIDGKGQFSVYQNKPLGEEPVLGPAREQSGAQSEQIGKQAAK